MPKIASCLCTQEARFATFDHRVNARKSGKAKTRFKSACVNKESIRPQVVLLTLVSRALQGGQTRSKFNAAEQRNNGAGLGAKSFGQDISFNITSAQHYKADRCARTEPTTLTNRLPIYVEISMSLLQATHR
jgi:hypothetical protein